VQLKFEGPDDLRRLEEKAMKDIGSSDLMSNKALSAFAVRAIRKLSTKTFWQWMETIPNCIGFPKIGKLVKMDALFKVGTKVEQRLPNTYLMR